ncbi:MAG TPA: hypothetical protein VFA45_03955 [Actinomycetes bacterium]|nr:hypothetical protein [Actinomycetes bacterium]
MRGLPFACSAHWAIYQLQHRPNAAGYGGGLHLSVASVVALAAAAIAIAALAWIAGGWRRRSVTADDTSEAGFPGETARQLE